MRFTFGDVTFDDGTRQLRRGGREVHLTRKAFELLGFLIERRPDAVSREDIHARLWPGTFVSEATLQSLVFELREAIGDKARSPRFIRTVHGFGYAFCGSVDEGDRTPPVAQRPVRGWLLGEMGKLPLFDGENVLGRSVQDGIELTSTTVSRRHARITFEDGASLEDLGSKNGTFARDRPVTGRVRLADGDQLRIGSFLLTFRLARSADKTSTQTVSPRREKRTPRAAPLTTERRRS